MKMRFDPKNHTPHDINIRLGDGSELSYKTVGVCRAVAIEGCAFQWDPENTDVEGHYHGWGSNGNPCLVVMKRPRYDRVEWSTGDPGQDTDVIVSVVAAPAVVESRPDLRVFIPDTGPQSAIRGKDGRIEAIRRLVLWHDPRASTHVLRAISLLNPVNEGDGSYLHSVHEPTREGILEAIEESGNAGHLELSDQNGVSRLSHHCIMPGPGATEEHIDEVFELVQGWLGQALC